MKKILKIDWDNEYDKLRLIHSRLKDIMKERVGGKNGIPCWFGEPKDLPKDYYKSLEKINDALYDTEEIVNEKIGF